MNSTLLVELFTEELPPKALARLGEAFAQGVAQGLRSRGLLNDEATISPYATPRRLAVSISDVRALAPDRALREKILPVSVALDPHGQPTAPLTKKLAALGFAHIGIDALERASDGKTEVLYYNYTAPGMALAPALQAALEETITKLPIPKVMSYQRPDGATVHFVRPVHRIIALHGDTLVPLALLGLSSGRETLGHRFLAPQPITLKHAEHYAAALAEQGYVIASIGERKARIRAALLDAAGTDQVLMPESLLDEVAALVEWPVVYTCSFEPSFLSVPQECLILTMQTNQKYFALTDAQGKLRSRFLIVSNLATDDPQHIISGNERVVRPRLSDAQFFFEQDQKKTLAERLPLLANVVYHNKLGSQAERTERVAKLAERIACTLSANIEHATRAARLAKADLLTDMVGEFPELQGIMGRYYAIHDGEPAEVAAAMAEHYQPRFAGDALPLTQTGTIVALADKLETLVGIWGIGLQPTGEKDPFALRRHVLGILRMLVEKRLPLSLSTLFDAAEALFSVHPHFTAARADMLGFVYDRLRGQLRERGFSAAEAEAVVAQAPDRLDDLLERLTAVQSFARLPQAEALAAANKRITNILKKAEHVPGAIDPSRLLEEAERRLAATLATVQEKVEAACQAGDFTRALETLAALRPEVDAFFNDVMVNAEDPYLRANRLALLATLHGTLNRVADISRLAA